jgi:hypothetical protein
MRNKKFSSFNSSTISDDVMQFPSVWRGNSDAAKSRANNKQLNDTKEQRLHYVLHILFIRR